MKSDIEIAQAAKLEKISDIAAKLDIPEDSLEPFGHYKAKISLDYLNSIDSNPDGKLILVTAISPTPAGEGKTTTSVGLGDALNHIGKKALVTIREPSLGPVFGMKGGAAGGGMSQVIPMEDINLHFTGDFNAIQLANNLLAAMLDNHIHHGNKLAIDVRRVSWKRVLDMNDRALRNTVCSLGSVGNGYPRQDGFDIVVASEIMAIFCLATSISDLKEKIARLEEENKALENLEMVVRLALNNNEQLSPQYILCLACYKSLNNYAWSSDLIITTEIQEVFNRQVVEPTEETKLRSTIPILKEIKNFGLKKVKSKIKIKGS